MKSVVVITPSIGKPELEQAIASVKAQTYGNVKHLIVADGPMYVEKVIDRTLLHDLEDGRVRVNYAPGNTGANGYYGHRIYAGYSQLVDQDYVCFLDEDNWYEPNHIETLVAKIEANTLDWAYSLRSVYLDNRKLAEDCCESIGAWPIWFTQEKPREEWDHLVDTSSYCFKREWLIQHSQLWQFGWGGDRRFFKLVMGKDRFGTTGLHTLNYRLPDMARAYGGQLDFFEKGNEAVKQRYGGYPWIET
jgi:glycosyltransferase involved in cell wall biosynthesis